ncbi:outer membrane protein, adhesin transport system [Marivita hallyeonensis]|uniref:Outer membrane protein, adhesin transport system n=2 Tax=Marivita hallyeonensis TaxID=996342 RepID=A0A1M5X6R9_9RHOB|nr:outer membrane protein, adhesin transport system [Marivita hallyeonensis]
MRQRTRATAGAVLVTTALTGCMQDLGDGAVSRFLTTEPAATSETRVAAPVPSDASPVISALSSRSSVLTAGSPYDQVAAGVLAADARVAEAELHVAKLRAEAASKNWLPTLSPRISLTSLGDFVADLVVNQVLFDNGRKKAERDLAKADVELAAVALSESSNDRVYDGLVLYLQAEEGRAAADLYAQALKDMGHFEWVMDERVKGGVSDFSDLNVIRQKIADLRSRDSAAREKTTRALGELNAMSATSLSDLRGLRSMGTTPETMSLSVLRAMVERDQQLAQARIARAQHLPGLSVGGSIRNDGENIAVTGGSDVGLGLGTMASLDAIEATKVTADRKVTEARDIAQRAIEADQREIAALNRQAEEAAALTRQAKQNLDLFQRQYEGGARQVMDVVGVYETFLRALEKELDLKFRAARAELDAAKRLGILADGARI